MSLLTSDAPFGENRLRTPDFLGDGPTFTVLSEPMRVSQGTRQTREIHPRAADDPRAFPPTGPHPFNFGWRPPFHAPHGRARWACHLCQAAKQARIVPPTQPDFKLPERASSPAAPSAPPCPPKTDRRQADMRHSAPRAGPSCATPHSPPPSKSPQTPAADPTKPETFRRPNWPWLLSKGSIVPFVCPAGTLDAYTIA